MEESRRRALRRCRVRFVAALRVAPLWGPLEARGVFTRAMIEELQAAGSRGDQARQLLIDLETRGRHAFPAFLAVLRDTGQAELAELLSAACEASLPAPPLVSPSPPPAPLSPSLPHVPSSLPHVQPSRGGPVPIPSLLRALPWACLCQVYDLKADPCGYCLILNNVNFSPDSELSTRAGSSVDCEKLQKRFKSLHFDVVTRQDLIAQEMVRELQELARLDHSARDCCLVVILSHGCQTSHIQFPGGIYGTDGKAIPVEKIVNYFNGSNCPSLRGKPKLFFIQACGGEQKDRGFEVESDSPGDEAPGFSAESDATPFQAPSGASDELDAVASLPTPSDILVSYSTFPGFVSWRDKSSGSWYVETLDNVLDQYAHSEDLLNMLLRVAHAVSAKGRYKQIPGCFNFLRKKFFFMCQ
ncbi:CASP9 protein, partial [Crypturellus soui]|nr:CASP9 protein [Crypturellus soui]